MAFKENLSVLVTCLFPVRNKHYFYSSTNDGCKQTWFIKICSLDFV